MANIKTWTGERLAKFKEMLLEGNSLQVCADHFGVNKTTLSKVRKLYLPEVPLAWDLQREETSKNRKERLARSPRGTTLKDAQKHVFGQKFWNAKRNPKWEFTVTMDDLVWPTHCPVLGIELDWFSPRKAENSPSFDRIDPSKGYVPGNVAIISWRANRIKNDGSAEEHRRIAEWMCN